MEKIRVLLVDDHTMFRQGLRSLLCLFGDVEVVGEAGGGNEAIEQVRLFRPDVVLLDISMPGLGGLDVARGIRKELPRTKFLIVTQHKDSEYLRSMAKVGVMGFILKTAPASELILAIRTVYRGEAYLDSWATGNMVDAYRMLNRTGRRQSGALSDREKDILRLMAEGRNSERIATELSVAVRTVRRHQAHCRAKLGLRNSNELLYYALTNHALLTTDRR